MLGILSATLTTDKRRYLVGEMPKYTLTNAKPGSIIKWSSFKDGVSTGEYEENYGDVVGSVGGVELTGGAWTTDQVGNWQKIASVYGPDGSHDTVQATFSVEPVNQQTPAPQPATPSNWLAGKFEFNAFGQEVSINRGLGLAGIGLAVYGLSRMSGGGRRR